MNKTELNKQVDEMKCQSYVRWVDYEIKTMVVLLLEYYKKKGNKMSVGRLIRKAIRNLYNDLIK